MKFMRIVSHASLISFFSFSFCTALVLGKSVVFVDVVRTDYNSFARKEVSSCDANVFPRLGIIIAAMGGRGGGRKNMPIEGLSILNICVR